LGGGRGTFAPLGEARLTPKKLWVHVDLRQSLALRNRLEKLGCTKWETPTRKVLGREVSFPLIFILGKPRVIALSDLNLRAIRGQELPSVVAMKQRQFLLRW